MYFLTNKFSLQDTVEGLIKTQKAYENLDVEKRPRLNSKNLDAQDFQSKSYIY